MLQRSVALFGGTFDPPHLGHLVCAAEVLDAGGFDEVVLMVSHDPWQKSERTDLTPAAVRLDMTAAAVARHRGLVAGDLEIRRGGPTYTIDTVLAILGEGPDTDVAVVVGADAAARLDTWHRADELAALAEIVVIPRPGAAMALPGPPWRARVTDVPAIEISSTDVRERCRAGRSIDFLVPESVVSVIAERRLYGFAR